MKNVVRGRCPVYILTLGALEHVLGFADVAVRDRGRTRFGGRNHRRPPPHLTLFSSSSTRRSPATRAFDQQAPRSRRQQRTTHGVVLTFLKKRKCCSMMDTSQPISKFAGRTGPLNRQDVPRQQLAHHQPASSSQGGAGTNPAPSRTHMTSLMVPRTFIQRKLPSQSCSRLSLQALRTRVRRNSSEVCQKNHPLLDALDPSLFATRDLHDGLRGTHARRPEAGARPNVAVMKTRWYFGVTENYTESSTTFRSLAKALSHHANSTSGASTLCRHPSRGSFS